MDYESDIPLFDLSKNPQDLEEGSEGWKKLCQKLREACENYGCFQVVYDKIPKELHDKMFMALKELYDLPEDIKSKYSKYFKTHFNIKEAPYYESLSISDSHSFDEVRAVTDLFWSDGNPTVCQIVSKMSKEVLDLEHILRKMIFESYGLVDKYYEKSVKECRTIMGFTKYRAPPAEEPVMVGIPPHADRGILTLIYPDSEGLEILSKDGNRWIQVSPKECTFAVFVGQSFKAWSNGRLHAIKHQVIMKGEKDRYSYGSFATPLEESTIETANELVDEDHPLIYRPFTYKELVTSSKSAKDYLDSIENYRVKGTK